MNKLEWLIAWRYLGAQRKSLFVSLIGIFSMLGVSIGVFALVVALAAVNGFEEEVTAQMIGKDAHFELMAYNGEPVTAYDSLINEVKTRDSSVVAASPFIIYKVGISSKKVNDGIVIYGIDPETAKNVTSQRTIPIMIPELTALLTAAQAVEQKVVAGSPNSLCKQINRLCEKESLPQVGVHGLRHSFASLGYHLGISEREMMELGGWADTTTMHKIYTHIAKADRLKSENKLADFFKNANGNANYPAKTL